MIAAFRRMVRGNEFDICEMAITTYICAKAHGKPMTAIPVFIVRAFHHGAILVNTKAGISRPKDLEGKRVGVNRGYTVTTGVWARGVLQDEHGVDLSKITWVLSGDEHVAEYKPPANVVPIEPGKKMEDMLAVGRAGRRHRCRRQVARREAAHSQRAGGRARGAAAARSLSHQPYGRDQGRHCWPLTRTWPPTCSTPSRGRSGSISSALKAGQIEKPTAVDEMHRRVMEITGDPLPYGVDANRKVLEELIGHAVTQGIVAQRVAVDELFHPSTRGLQDVLSQ